MIIRNVIFLVVFCLGVFPEKSGASMVLTEQQTLAIFKSVISNFEKTGFGLSPKKVDRIENKKQAGKAFSEYWKEFGREVSLPTGAKSIEESVREFNGYFFQVRKDDGLNCTIIFCEKNGNVIYSANFGPRYT